MELYSAIKKNKSKSFGEKLKTLRSAYEVRVVLYVA